MSSIASSIVAGTFLVPEAIALVGSTVLGGVMSSDAQSSAAQSAAGAQTAAADAGIAEQRRQFNEIQKILKPYVDAGAKAISGLAPYQKAGEPALLQQQALLGLSGAEAQRQAIAAISGGQEMAALTQQGENALLQNASATGGLRGGNLQEALAKFRPQLLSNLVNQQYARLGGLTDMGRTTAQNLVQFGQASAAGQASHAGAMGSNITNLLGQQGSAQALQALSQGQSQANLWGGLGQMGSTLGTLALMGKF